MKINASFSEFSWLTSNWPTLWLSLKWLLNSMSNPRFLAWLMAFYINNWGWRATFKGSSLVQKTETSHLSFVSLGIIVAHSVYYFFTGLTQCFKRIVVPSCRLTNGAQGLTVWRLHCFATEVRTNGCMMGNTGGLLSIQASPPELPLFLSHTWAANPQEAVLLRRQRSGTLLSDALSHAGVCCGWCWKPDPFSFKNTVLPALPPWLEAVQSWEAYWLWGQEFSVFVVLLYTQKHARVMFCVRGMRRGVVELMWRLLITYISLCKAEHWSESLASYFLRARQRVPSFTVTPNL